MLSNLPAALVAILFFGPASESWPEFRGPTGQGIAPEGPLPGEWSPTKNVAWKHPIPGSGWSSPVVDAEQGLAGLRPFRDRDIDRLGCHRGVH